MGSDDPVQRVDGERAARVACDSGDPSDPCDAGDPGTSAIPRGPRRHQGPLRTLADPSGDASLRPDDDEGCCFLFGI